VVAVDPDSTLDHSIYAARPAPIGSQVLVRKFARRLEIRNLQTQALLRTPTAPDRSPHRASGFSPLARNGPSSRFANVC